MGAGPAGLVLSHLLAGRGIESVVLEHRDREYVEKRVRAGVLEQGSVNLLVSTGVGERLQRECMVHHGVQLQFGGARHRIPLTELTGDSIFVYGQQEVVKDLIQARLDAGGTIVFEAEAIGVDGQTTATPTVRYRQQGALHELQADYVAGCDGYHGVCRDAIPQRARTVYEKDYPFAWLGILAAVPPSTEEVIYCNHQRGFALHSMRSPQLSRLYVQCAPDDDLDSWPDERIWEELQTRFALPGFTLESGRILEKGITPMRSFVLEPMQHGRLFLAGDAAHIVPPTGAKGMNLAIADAKVLAEALAEWYASGKTELLDGYSDTCLKRVWRAEHFSWWMTMMLHRFQSDDEFQRRLQLSQLRYVTTSKAAATSMAENYVGRYEV